MSDADASELVDVLRRWREGAGDLSGTMSVVAEQLVAAVNDRFDSAGEGTFAPLAESTLKGRRGTSAQILVDTGRFAGSIRGDSGPDFAEAATDVSYAVFHVSDEARSRIPLRNVFDVNDDVLGEARMTIVAGVLAEFAA